MNSSSIPPESESRARSPSRCGLRYALIGLGWLCVGLGAVGVLVPGMPTTVFLLVALWAFSKSSDRFRTWLYEHPKFGPPIRAWHEHRVISVPAKLLAVGMMGLSLAVLVWIGRGSPALPVIVGAVMIPVAAFIVSRRSRPPERAVEESGAQA